MNYNNKIFRPIVNSDHGEVDENTLFAYKQTGNIITCSYSGSRIITGHLIGLVDANGCIKMQYHQINIKGELMSGICFSKPEILANDRIRLHENWQWTSGSGASGTSVLEEIILES